MNRLKEERKKLGKNQTQIAKLLNMSQQNYANYENEVSLANQETMKSIAKIFNKPVAYLFCLDEQTPQPTQIEEEVEIDLSDDQIELIEITNELSSNEINRLIGYAKSMRDKELSIAEKFDKILKDKGV